MNRDYSARKKSIEHTLTIVVRRCAHIIVMTQAQIIRRFSKQVREKLLIYFNHSFLFFETRKIFLMQMIIFLHEQHVDDAKYNQCADKLEA